MYESDVSSIVYDERYETAKSHSIREQQWKRVEQSRLRGVRASFQPTAIFCGKSHNLTKENSFYWEEHAAGPVNDNRVRPVRMCIKCAEKVRKALRPPKKKLLSNASRFPSDHRNPRGTVILRGGRS
jgi:hypothetical protein